MKSNIAIDDSKTSICISIFCLYFLLAFFIFYLYLLKRIDLHIATVSWIIFSVIYSPRFFLLHKIACVPSVNINDDYLVFGNRHIRLAEISKFVVEKKKPIVLFFLNAKMVVYNEFVFHIKTVSQNYDFLVISREKALLLEEYISRILEYKNKC